MKSRPPGLSSLWTTSAQRLTDGNQMSAPMPVKTRSNSPFDSTSAASYTSASMKSTPAPSSSLSAWAWATATGLKSSPVIRAPSLDSEIVSVPMWHCRWTPRSPCTSPSSGWSNVTTSDRYAGSLRNSSRW